MAISESEKKYGRYCHTIAYNICGRDDDAEECVNDTLFRAWNLMPDKRPKSLGAFLCRITRNLALNRVKAEARQKRGGGQVALLRAIDGVCDDEIMNAGAKYISAAPKRRVFGKRLAALAMAAAVHETDNYPPMDEETTRALAELGDWRIAAPQGYAELVTYGAAGEYGYITRVYADAGHNEIKLDYEQSVTDLAGYVDYYRTPDAGYGEISFTELSIDGNVAWLLEKPDGTPFRLTWQEAEHGLTFTLAANKLTSDELIKAAQGIRLYN